MKNGENAVSLTSKTDYYPFGMPMPNRNIEGNYRYKFQGQEKDSETGMEAFELRLWDSRIGRWLSPDPKKEFSSPYLGMGNNPIVFIDRKGDTIQYFTPEAKRVFKHYLKPIIATKIGAQVYETLQSSPHDYWVGIGSRWEFDYKFKVDKDIYGSDYVRSITIGRMLNSYQTDILDRDGNPRRIFGILGHEIWHAFDYDNSLTEEDFRGSGRDLLEDRAVYFENYLYASYGYDDRRTKYTGRDVKYPNILTNQVRNILEKTSFSEQIQNPVSQFWIWTWNDNISDNCGCN